MGIDYSMVTGINTKGVFKKGIYLHLDIVDWDSDIFNMYNVHIIHITSIQLGRVP